MKSIILGILIGIITYLFPFLGKAQEVTSVDTVKTEAKIYIVEKNDGIVYVGKIISQDAREVLIETKNIGQIYIPKHEIKSIKEAKADEYTSNGEFIPNEVFSTRYFLTTNGLPIEKGESYIQWNIFGPDFQFGVGKNFSLGVMTSWIGMPIIGTAKGSINLGPKVNLAIGGLIGTGSWVAPDFAFALPFTALTIGDRKANINFSAGYGVITAGGDSDGRFLMSIAAMKKGKGKISFVFDSFIMPSLEGDNGFGILVPGLRFQTDAKKAFQFGFGGLIADGEMLPIPVPMVQWFQKF